MTDSGLRLLKNCSNIQALTLNYCDQFSGHGLRIVYTVTELEGLMGLLAETISIFACRNNITDVRKPAGQCCILQDKTCLNICVTRKLMKLQKDIIF